MEQDEFLIAVGQPRDPSLVRIKTKEGKVKAAELGWWGGLGEKSKSKKDHLFFH